MEKCLYCVTVLGEPKAQPRPRKGKHGNFYSNTADIEAWKQNIQVFLHMSKHNKPEMITAPITIKLFFYFHKDGIVGNKPHISKPDTDNLIKPVLDSLKDFQVYKDDSQVYRIFAQKYWTVYESRMEIVVIQEEAK
jgi:Holliday junction resolvase RusA-like endonuclease